LPCRKGCFYYFEIILALVYTLKRTTDGRPYFFGNTKYLPRTVEDAGPYNPHISMRMLLFRQSVFPCAKC